MERSAIRSVAFGGFDKEDVARYIEQLSQETEKLREERDALQEKADCLEKEADELRTQVQELTKAREELSAEMARLAPLEKENAQLKEQVEALRPDAEAHVMLRGQVGAIECEARQRAAELEEHTAGQMHKALDLFRQQYQILMSTFEPHDGGTAENGSHAGTASQDHGSDRRGTGSAGIGSGKGY